MTLSHPPPRLHIIGWVWPGYGLAWLGTVKSGRDSLAPSSLPQDKVCEAIDGPILGMPALETEFRHEQVDMSW